MISKANHVNKIKNPNSIVRANEKGMCTGHITGHNLLAAGADNFLSLWLLSAHPQHITTLLYFKWKSQKKPVFIHLHHELHVEIGYKDTDFLGRKFIKCLMNLIKACIIIRCKYQEDNCYCVSLKRTSEF